MVRLISPARLAPLFAVAALAFSGCATFNEAELGQLRSRGVSGPVLQKMDRGRPLSPADVKELTQQGVPEAIIIKQLNEHGVDSVISRGDVIALRGAGVRPRVIDALLQASDRMAREYASRESYWISDDYDPWLGPRDPQPGIVHGEVGIGFSTGSRIRPYR